MEWSREERYRRLSDVEPAVYEELLATVNQSQYRQKFHIQPKTGLLNDPNGFSFFNGYYHLFYQWFPLGPVHGVKYWYHVKSKDLVNWIDEGIALEPDTPYDSHGVFSGTGLATDEQLYLFYTGNTRTEDWTRIPYQCIATLDKAGTIRKHDNPFIVNSPEGYTDNFRDPKVFKQGNHYICLVGAEREDGQGAIVYYTSSNLLDWKMEGEINVQPYDNAGYMWECPDYFELDGKGVLLFSPQGMEAMGDHYQNIFQSGYLLGDPINFENGVFNHLPFQELDKGFEFYAPQTMLDPSGRRILIAWFGLPGVDCVTDNDGWAHCLTLPRVLEIKDNHLYQKPLPELTQLRKEQFEWTGKLRTDMPFSYDNQHRTYELLVSFKHLKGHQVGLKFRIGGEEETVFYYDRKQKKLIFDRSQSGLSVTDEYGHIRKADFDGDELTLHLFVDESSVEIFVNDGYYVFSSRLFNHLTSNQISCFVDGECELALSQWSIS